MKARDFVRMLALVPLLAAFGPGNCEPAMDFGTRGVVPNDPTSEDVDDDSYAITIPRGVAVVLHCRGTCNDLAVHSLAPERVYAAATRTRDLEVNEIAVLVGLVEGEAQVGADAYDFSYTFNVRVVEPEADTGQAMRAITIP